MTAIGRDEILHVANLARLQIADSEIPKFAAELSKILDYVEQLEAVDTTGVEPTAHPIPLENVLRDDVVRPSMPTDKLLANAKDRTEDCYKVPAVLAGGGSA